LCLFDSWAVKVGKVCQVFDFQGGKDGKICLFLDFGEAKDGKVCPFLDFPFQMMESWVKSEIYCLLLFFFFRWLFLRNFAPIKIMFNPS
jgi:hypothetical protein